MVLRAACLFAPCALKANISLYRLPHFFCRQTFPHDDSPCPDVTAQLALNNLLEAGFRLLSLEQAILNVLEDVDSGLLKPLTLTTNLHNYSPPDSLSCSAFYATNSPAFCRYHSGLVATFSPLSPDSENLRP